jgi:hypothetical protein
MPWKQACGRLREEHRELPDARVGHLRHEQSREPALRVDHVRGWGVVDLSLHDLRFDSVGVPDRLDSCERPVEGVPGAHHPVRFRVRTHPASLGRIGICANAQQFHLSARRPEQPLGLHHRGRGERADRRALRVVEREDHHLAAEIGQRDRSPELIRRREIGGGPVYRRAGIERWVARERRSLRRWRRESPRERDGAHHDRGGGGANQATEQQRPAHRSLSLAAAGHRPPTRPQRRPPPRTAAPDTAASNGRPASRASWCSRARGAARGG